MVKIAATSFGDSNPLLLPEEGEPDMVRILTQYPVWIEKGTIARYE
jgi:hypothetical protein